MELQFVKMNPTQNMTILVETPVPREQHGEVARLLMAGDSVCAEQVGYIEPAENPKADAHLQMMGGEFCGNASMSLAALLAMRDGLDDGEKRSYTLEVSGADNLVGCTIVRDAEAFIGEVDMPLPYKIGTTEQGYPAVFFPGIVHLIIPEDALSPADAEKFAPMWCSMLNADALGLLLTDKALTHMRPLVYVRGCNSSVWERGCGSGTAALGAYKACSTGCDAEVSVSQPGGTIRALAKIRDEKIVSLRIRGRVAPVCAGRAYLGISD